MRLVIMIIACMFLGLQAEAQTRHENSPADEQLDLLFGQLKRTDIGAEVLRVESNIWQLWMVGGTPGQNDILQRAAVAMGSGQMALSETILNGLITQTQTFPEAYNKRATLYYLVGRYDESLADIAVTLELEPRHFGALSGKGMVLQKLGRNGEALAVYREALSVNPHMVGAKLAIQQLESLVPDL